MLQLVERVHERVLQGVDPDAFRLGDLTLDLAVEMQAGAFDDMADLGVSVGDLASAFRVPRDWILLERTALLLIGLCTTLDPDANPLRVLRPHIEPVVGDVGAAAGGAVAARAQDALRTALGLPARLDRVLAAAEAGTLAAGRRTRSGRRTASTPGSAKSRTRWARRARAGSRTRRTWRATAAWRQGSRPWAGRARWGPSARRCGNGGDGGRAAGARAGWPRTLPPPRPAPVSSPNVKSRGAYYTDRAVADFLVRWAVRGRADVVLDPSFGGGVFLRAAAERIEALGGHPARQVFGVELDDAEHSRVGSDLRERWPFNGSLLRSDFFDVEPDAFGPINAVVGNPPFIRFQRFKGAARQRAMGRALAQGVRLPKMASSWAAFTVHAAALVRRGGRLAFVLPAEIGYTDYALPVLHFLQRSFGALTLITFRRKLFPDLSESTVLLLADDAGGRANTVRLVDLDDADALTRFDLDRHESVSVDALGLARRDVRLSEYLLSSDSREAFTSVREATWALGDLARVGIGYVTGANGFFHVREAEAQDHGLPTDVLRPTVLRGRALDGIAYRQSDWEQARDAGEPAYLLDLNRPAPLEPCVEAYLAGGVADGVPDAYKCRVRTPWYAVPHVHTPDAFLTYMSGWGPQIVSNEARVTAPNSLHLVRLHPSAPVSARTLAALWQTSLARLSAEVEGRALGGGMLKLEPREAGRVCIPRCLEVPADLPDRLDHLIRDGQQDEAQTLADDVVLRGGVGVDAETVQALRNGADDLRKRRTEA